jgi:long-chain acyl-CoA synthetase
MTITCLNRLEHKKDASGHFSPKLNSVGRSHATIEIRITDENGLELPNGQVGEIEVKGPTVMQGYWQNSEATQKSLKDGWLKTGDMGRLDAHGYLTLIDRSKDVIISGGSNIYPREVEEVLLTHPVVSEVSVVGLKDEEWGEIVVACIVSEPGMSFDQSALDKHCLDAIARFKRPKIYVEFEALPKNSYGKILRREIREKLEKEKATSIEAVNA